MKRARTVAWALASVLTVALAVHGAAPADAKYRGSKLCIACHGNKDTNADAVKRYVVSPMALAMVDMADKDTDKVKSALKADFAGAPFKQEDVAYIFGNGMRQQAFLDKDYKVLPAKWDVASKKWVETPAVDAADKCIACHTTNFRHDEKKWKQSGVGCESCHGAGSTHASSNKIEDITNPAKLDPKMGAYVCGNCHSKGTSTDGSVPWPQGYTVGDDLSKFFKHDTPTAPGQNQQLTDLMASKHWDKGTLCTTCHDPHGATANPCQLKKPITELCLSCHAKTQVDIPTHTKAKNVIAPAGATCASCHMPQGRHLFSPKAVVVAK